MTEIPTTRQLFNEFSKERCKDGLPLYNSDIIDFAIKVTKLHVKAALENAYKNSTCSNKPKFEGDINYQVDEESILNAYLLTLIK